MRSFALTDVSRLQRPDQHRRFAVAIAVGRAAAGQNIFPARISNSGVYPLELRNLSPDWAD